MKLKAIIIVLSLLSLSACSHLRQAPESGVLSDSAANAENSSDSSNSAAELEETDQGEVQAPASENIATDTPVSQESSSSIASAIAEPVVKAEIDVLDRIRQGFRLPDLDSKYIADYERWDSTHPTYLTNLLKRAEPFLFHIVEEIEKRGLPMELALLPAIESAYKPTALSRSKASGLWQFVSATGRDYGLHHDWWYDARRDPLAATDAALTYLSRLNKMFDGDWFITLAAYNAGPGTLGRAIKANKRKNRGTQYQDLKLRSETRRYVPKLLALKNIINDPARFNVSLPKIKNQAYFEVVELPGQIDLHKFATQSGIPLNQIQHMNAGFKRWATSPKGPHRLLLPVQDAMALSKARSLIAAAPKIEYRNHQINSGETLSEIARQYGIGVEALRTTNNIRGTQIRAGKNLLIPVRGQSIPKDKILAQSSISNIDPSQAKHVHHVRKGDTLWSIARHYKVQMQQLLTWNNISTDQTLNLNQALLVFKN